MVTASSSSFRAAVVIGLGWPGAGNVTKPNRTSSQPSAGKKAQPRPPKEKREPSRHQTCSYIGNNLNALRGPRGAVPPSQMTLAFLKSREPRGEGARRKHVARLRLPGTERMPELTNPAGQR